MLARSMPVPSSCQSLRARSHGDKAHILRCHPFTRQHPTHKGVGGRARGGHTDAPPHQIAHRFKLGQRALRYAQGHLRRTPMQHHRAQRKPTHLLANRVLISPGDHIHRALLQRLQRQRPARKIPQHHLQPLSPEKAKLVRQQHGQMEHCVLACHRQCHAAQVSSWRRLGSQHGCKNTGCIGHGCCAQSATVDQKTRHGIKTAPKEMHAMRCTGKQRCCTATIVPEVPRKNIRDHPCGLLRTVKK